MKPDTQQLNSLIARATHLHESGQLAEAAEIYRSVMALSPQHAAVIHNLGVIAAMQGDYKTAIGHFDAALRIAPTYVPAHLHRAMTQQAVGETTEAIRSYERIRQLDPGHYKANRELGFLWLANGHRGRSLDHFARTYDLRRGEDRTTIAWKSLSHATRDKLLHDAEQFRFLSSHRSRARFTDLAQRYETVAKTFSEAPTELSDQQVSDLGPDYNTAINLHDAPERKDNTLADRTDRAAVIAAFRESRAAAVVLDDFLTPDALRSLRAYLLQSTVWHDFTHIAGFVASYLEDGLACPLLLQIADEIRQAFPEILSDQPLSQAWAFKGLHSASSIGAHADDAFVSVNFWVTPNDANLQPDGSGLTVCLEPPPSDWAMADYGSDESRSARFMSEHADKILRVPYRENRAVLFHSRLLHGSEAPLFAEGYENHRMNLTLLYGRSPTRPAAFPGALS